jgi:hypothetical protein
VQTQRLDLVGRLAVKRFTTYTLTLTFRQPTGEPMDFTGCEAQAQIRSAYDALNPTTFATEFAADRTTGQLSCIIDATNYADLPSGKYVWDLIFQLADGTYWSPLEGDVIVKATSTQWQFSA